MDQTKNRMSVSAGSVVQLVQELRRVLDLMLLFRTEMEALRALPKETQLRLQVIALFAFVEAICTQFRRMAVELANNEGTLDEADLFLARGLMWRVGKDGTPEPSDLRIKFLSKLQFSLRVVAKAIGSDWKIDRSGKGWNAFQRSVTVRDRLVHPTSTSPLVVTEQEGKDLVVSLKWFVEIVEVFAREMTDYMTLKEDVLRLELAEVDEILSALGSERRKNALQGQDDEGSIPSAI